MLKILNWCLIDFWKDDVYAVYFTTEIFFLFFYLKI